MNEITSAYVDFQRFFQARQNLDLVSAEQWRHTAEIVARSMPTQVRALRRARKHRKTL